MIEIITDFQKTCRVDEFNPKVMIVGQIEQYIPLRQWLRRALSDPDHNYTVYLQRPLLMRWLGDLKDYPPNLIHWKDLNLRDRFQEQFGFLPPIELADDDLESLKLLELGQPSQVETNNPTGWILGHKLDPIWKTSQPNTGHLAALAAWSVTAGPVHKSLITLARKRLAEWAAPDNRYQLFLDQPWSAAGESILLRYALKNYPAEFNLCQQQQSAPVEDCQLQTTVIITILEKYRADINAFWRGWLAKQPDFTVTSVITMMSGLAQVELDILVDRLRENPASLNISVLDAIRHQFTKLPGLQTTLTRLENLVPPPEPQTPQSNWSTEQWLTWSTDEYMPYFAWVIRQQQPRNRQMVLAGQFADWLVSAYPGLIFSSNPVLITTQQSYLRQLLTTNQVEVIFWLIVDGLTWWQGRQLAGLCTQAGFGVVELGPILSALPSVTSVSKRAMVLGYLDQTQTKLPIAKLAEKRLADDEIPVVVHTQSDTFNTSLTAELQPGVHVLLYNALDRHNHDSRHFTDDESVVGHLNLITRLINTAFQQSLKQGFRARVMISSDHGSTLLPEDTMVLEPPRFAKLIADDDLDEIMPAVNFYQRTRVCAIEREPNSTELSTIEANWYLLQADVFNLPHHFLIPKGYAAVKRRPTGWTHGGATPEETITPFFEIRPQPIEIVPPIVSIDGSLRAAQPSELKITVINPNATFLNTVRLGLTGFPDSIEWPRIQPSTPYTQIIVAPPATGKNTTQTITWTLTCEIIGQRYQFSDQIVIPVRAFQRSAVDDLFEGML